MILCEKGLEGLEFNWGCYSDSLFNTIAFLFFSFV